MRRYIPFNSFNEFFVALVYFVQGSAGLVSIASALIFQKELNLDFYQMGLIGVAGTLPWTIKPIFGILTDNLPINRYRRRPYLHLGPLLGFLGYLYIGLYAHSFESFFLATIFANFGIALSDTATDGFVVEESNQLNAARIQGITQASIRVAAFLTSFFSGLLIFSDILTEHQMYLVLCVFPLLTFTASFFIKEKRIDQLPSQRLTPEQSITLETRQEYAETEKTELKLFTKGYIISLIAIFFMVVGNVVFGDQIAAFLADKAPGVSPTYVTILIWILFGSWMAAYFNKLRRLKLTTSMIFVAILFILLWRINPGAGSSMFFYLKDTLHINEKTLGFIDTIAQIGSIIGVILAVNIFDKIKLKTLLLVTVLIATAYGFSAFAITRPEFAETLAGNPLFSWIAVIMATPVYFFDSLFAFLFTGADFVNPITTAHALPPIEKFLYVQSILGELVFMIAYIPLLKFAVLITPKKAEATNFAIIASIMNVGLAISAWLSGYLYNALMARFHPDLAATAIQVDVIEILIWVNIITTATCLIVLPFLKTEQFVKET